MDNNPNITPPDENGIRYYKGNGSGQGPNDPKGKKNSGIKKPLIIIGAILLSLIILGASCTSMLNSIGSSDSSMEDVEGTYETPDMVLNDYIAVLHVEGTISSDNSSLGETGYNHNYTLDTIKKLIESPENKGILLYVNSPGGGVYESDELYVALEKYKKETGRPVYSYMASMAASGGYYISAPADKIIANRNCWTGSIGVTIGTIYDVSKLLDDYGIKTVTITSGKNKAMGSAVKPMTKEQQAIFQSLVDESYQQFVSIVAKGRNMPKEKVEKIADGRIYTAKQALSLNLIDSIKTYEDAQKTMGMEEGLSVEFAEFQPPKEDIFTQLFAQIKDVKKGSAGDIQGLLELMEKKGETPIAYMSETKK